MAKKSNGAAAPGNGKIEVYNKATLETIGSVPVFSKAEAQEAVAKCREAQKSWGALSLRRRAERILAFKDVLIDRADEVARLITMENGKTLQESVAMEILPIADLANYFAKSASRILEDRPIPLHLLKHKASYINYRPRGVILVISPWNFPFTIPMGETIMALLAGNGVVLKPASLTPLIALKAREIFDEAGLPADIFRVVTGPGSIGSEMIGMGVNFVNFTGSTRVGKLVAAKAGEHLLECSMELGGKDPMIVCSDASIERAANAAVFGAFANSGQVCASVERVYVMEDVYDDFVGRVVEKTKKLRQGNPLDNVDVGAMTDPGQIDIVERHVQGAVAAGAKVLTGGSRPTDLKGQFFAPTVLVNCDDKMECVREETFGPTLPILRVSDEEEAIRRSNDSAYGLNAYVFTKDKAKGRGIAERLEAGTVMVNDVLLTHGAPETPWGGVKESGMGRVHSDDGLRHMCVPYHVNYERISLGDRELFWYPMSHKNYKRMLTAVKLAFRGGIRNKIGALMG